MQTNAQPNLLGIGTTWPSRKELIKELRGFSPADTDRITNYNSRLDVKNRANVVEHSRYSLISNRQEAAAMSLAWEGNAWLPTLAYSTAYRLFADKMSFFWHYNFRLIFPDHPQPLQLFNDERATVGMAYAFILGWLDEALYQGYLAHAALNRKYQLVLPYEEEHRRGHAFMLRLFANWRGDISHQWPSYGYDEPIYEGLLENWRNPDPEVITPWLIAACDRHTHQAGRTTSKTFYDFSDPALARTPIEILMVLRLRETVGLQNPAIDHPLLEAPFDRLPEPQPKFEPDELMKGTLTRAREDWPEIDNVLSLESIKR